MKPIDTSNIGPKIGWKHALGVSDPRAVYELYITNRFWQYQHIWDLAHKPLQATVKFIEVRYEYRGA